MGGAEGRVALVMGIAVVFFVPALVWAIAIAGLRQIVRDKIRKTPSALRGPAQEVQRPTMSN